MPSHDREYRYGQGVEHLLSGEPMDRPAALSLDAEGVSDVLDIDSRPEVLYVGSAVQGGVRNKLLDSRGSTARAV